MNATFKIIALAGVAVAALGLQACSRNESQTVGQGVDKAIADAKEKGEAAKTATEDAAKKIEVGAADAAITAKVNAALIGDDTLKVLKVDVDTKSGRVSLMGTAPDMAARDRATTLVKAISGVSDVDNQLRVEPKP
jgi:hyperosmotically inducible periplasmic protein